VDERRLTVLGIVGVERAQDTILRRTPHDGIVERVDQGRNAKHVG